MSQCRGCLRQIEWIRTLSGKSMPVDPEPIRIVTGEGNQTFVTGEGEIIKGRPAKQGEAANDAGWVPHWATCPEADSFRRRR